MLGYPLVVRPSFTLGGSGSGIAYDEGDLRRIAGAGLDASPVTEVLLEESILGWKEYELELMRDRNDNVVVVCSIENIDPMGVHTGDSVTVAPAMTLTDREYQQMRDIAIATARAVGVDTGGCNIQFAVHPRTGRMVVIEMNPRVSRSSALASKATGFPIAKIAARLAIGYTLDEIRNDITGETPASFEPALDYVVVKVPRFAFEKFPGADPVLTTHMKSVGEAMAIGRSFPEALQKALRSLEQPAAPFSWKEPPGDKAELLQRCASPHDGRLTTVHQAIRAGASVTELAAATGIDPWFIDQIKGIDEHAERLAGASPATRPGPPRAGGPAPGGAASADPAAVAATLRAAKASGFSDAQVGQLWGMTQEQVRGLRQALGVRPVYQTVDTCAAEFAARTPYLYSTYDEQTEVPPGDRPKVIILGSGPNRIGQGIEFDYACVHASFALAQAGYETVMVNCNPETVSTDYDTSGRLYFEPLTLEDVLEVVHAEQASGPVAGVIVQLGGQTPLGLARALAAAGVPVVGTSPDAIHLAEDRGEFGALLAGTGLNAPRHGTATSVAEAITVAEEIGYPVLVRPSYVLGGRGMEIVYDDATLEAYVRRATAASPEHPVLIDKFLDDAIEIDVDALYDGGELYLGGVMEHIEEAGIHSGDSACALPPITLGREDIAAGPRRHRADRPGRRRPRAAECPVRARGGGAVRAGGEPAGVAHRAVRLQGDRGPAGQGGGPDHAGRYGGRPARRGHAAGQRRRRHPADGRADRGQGSGAAVRPVPQRPRRGRRHRARPGDALNRRGHGHRRGVRHRVRQVPGGRVRAAAGQRPRVRVGGQQGQALDDLPGQTPRRPGLRDMGDAGYRRGSAQKRGTCHDRA